MLGTIRTGRALGRLPPARDGVDGPGAAGAVQQLDDAGPVVRGDGEDGTEVGLPADREVVDAYLFQEGNDQFQVGLAQAERGHGGTYERYLRPAGRKHREPLLSAEQLGPATPRSGRADGTDDRGEVVGTPQRPLQGRAEPDRYAARHTASEGGRYEGPVYPDRGGRFGIAHAHVRLSGSSDGPGASSNGLATGK